MSKFLPITSKDKAYEIMGCLVSFNLCGRTIQSAFPGTFIIGTFSEEPREQTPLVSGALPCVSANST